MKNQISSEGLTELEQKWKSHWAQEDREVAQKGDGHVLGVNLAEGCRSAAIYKDGKFLSIRWQGNLPDDFLSPDCSQELRNSFFMRALKKEAEAALGTRVSEIVVAADGAQSLIRDQSYRKSATIAGVHCCRIVSDVSLAQFVATSPEDGGDDNIVAIISVDKTCAGVSICSADSGVYEILSKRGSGLANPSKPLSEIEGLYRECQEVAEKHVTKVFVCGNRECISSVVDTLHKVTGLEVRILDDSDTVAARGAAFQGAILKGTVKDVLMMDTCGMSLGVELADGSMKELIGRDVTVPVKCSIVAIPTEVDDGGLTVNVFEGNHEVAARNLFIGSLRLPSGVGDCMVLIDADANKCVTVTAKRISDGVVAKKTVAELSSDRLEKGRFRICETCQGSGKILCKTCHGEADSARCVQCGGSGRHGECTACHGKGHVICPVCEGNGVDYDQDPPVKCTKCEGKGKVKCSVCEGTGKLKCKSCNGSGKGKCPDCGGSGEIVCPDCVKRIKDAVAEKKRRDVVAAEKKRQEEAAALVRKQQESQRQKDVSLPATSATEKGDKPSSDDEHKTQLDVGRTGPKKRWKFVLLGLLFGWFGAHYMYAKRWLMLLLTLGSFATGVVMMDKSESNQKEESAQTVQQADGDASKSNGDAIGALCLVLWLVMWLGGALFVKKDGRGNRM